ncbi:MAG: SDR family NAD(P)-dependent oxidoreductase [Caulobacteraceae bacterium]|nr:SDR family NAD(P)-dependent oxidoreductase [Caulobacteraceae bacterium]
MGELRFEGRVALVTGAGGGIGRGYAQALAARGAKVVVNDIGIRPEYTAESTVALIRQAGGEAVADTHSIAKPDSAAEAVRTALETYGRLDILINNAGVAAQGAFGEIKPEDYARTLDTHLMGQIWTSEAAWPHMVAASYGRIVQISSTALFGMPGLWPYAVAKAGTLGLTKTLALEGARHGIRCNAVTPYGTSPGSDAGFSGEGSDIARIWQANYPTHLTAAGVVYLAHESCTLSGECLVSGGGRVARVFIAETPGIVDKAMTPEMVRDNLEAAMDETGYQVIGSGLEGGAYQAFRIGVTDRFEPGQELKWTADADVVA